MACGKDSPLAHAATHDERPSLCIVPAEKSRFHRCGGPHILPSVVLASTRRCLCFLMQSCCVRCRITTLTIGRTLDAVHWHWHPQGPECGFGARVYGPSAFCQLVFALGGDCETSFNLRVGEMPEASGWGCCLANSLRCWVCKRKWGESFYQKRSRSAKTRWLSSAMRFGSVSWSPSIMCVGRGYQVNGRACRSWE